MLMDYMKKWEGENLGSWLNSWVVDVESKKIPPDTDLGKN
jgi:hypothetical protein